ncbi:glycoside hydrolase family 61 protein [Tricharina praecox]|uniref:glycoside hydrolase family 61 protein n=1 Tax=Tricharina praecox TaxID=43433 RepID=UPI00221E96EA|nr:glycoside hydrolase family 61 protein [Tricharina praecox]KAI5852025.1 glycoside hydrolase family 61 protein [Tricharina praecox]
MKLTLAALLALATAVHSHATLQYINDNSAVIRPPPNNNPVTDVTSSAMACNVNGGVTRPTKLVVAAGSTVQLEWHHGGRDTQAIDPSHKGPVITYLAKVPDVVSATAPESLNWFKIQHDGMTVQSDGSLYWAVDKLVAAKGIYSAKIPSSIPSGDYLLRSEVIALHGASSAGGAQFYMGCAQISVTGGGSASPATVKLPGAYKSSDPGVTINIYYPVPSSYTIPGPAVFSG